MHFHRLTATLSLVALASTSVQSLESRIDSFYHRNHLMKRAEREWEMPLKTKERGGRLEKRQETGGGYNINAVDTQGTATICKTTEAGPTNCRSAIYSKETNTWSYTTQSMSTSKTQLSPQAAGPSGLLSLVFDGKCPHPKASPAYPNGDISFLNCNIKNGWSPPPVKADDIEILPSDEALQSPAFKPCHPHASHFKSISKDCNISVTLLMSIDMQESSCNARKKCHNGQVGLMQIPPQLCRGNCWEVSNNIHLGAQYFTDLLAANQDNIITACAAYDGWQIGMTTAEAMDKSDGCRGQRNLDYVNQMLNGWFQGKTGFDKQFTYYNNLAACK